MPPIVARRVVFLAPVVAAAMIGCGNGSSGGPSADAGGTDAARSPETAGADGSDAGSAPSDDASDSGTATGTDGGAADGAMGGDAGAPTVVAALSGFPASLALAGDSLYVTIAATSTGHDGTVQSVGKTALSATTDAGTVATLASGLNAPKAIAVDGTHVYWADTETAFPNYPSVLGVATSGGAATEILSNVTTLTRLVIANSVLYTIGGNLTTIVAYPLTSNDAGSARTIYPGNPPNGVIGPDSDGTSVFFFTNGATNFDLFQVSATGAPLDAGSGAKDLAMNVTSGSVDYDFLVDDATSIYWSDSATSNVYSLPKTGGTPKQLATVTNGSGGAQLALDGDNVYALSSSQLVRFPKSGGTQVVLASVTGGGQDRYLVSVGAGAVALAVDNAFAYWLFEGQKEILKIAK